jgi:hypothetical protein
MGQAVPVAAGELDMILLSRRALSATEMRDAYKLHGAQARRRMGRRGFDARGGRFGRGRRMAWPSSPKALRGLGLFNYPLPGLGLIKLSGQSRWRPRPDLAQGTSGGKGPPEPSLQTIPEFGQTP